METERAFNPEEIEAAVGDIKSGELKRAPGIKTEAVMDLDRWLEESFAEQQAAHGKGKTEIGKQLDESIAGVVAGVQNTAAKELLGYERRLLTMENVKDQPMLMRAMDKLVADYLEDMRSVRPDMKTFSSEKDFETSMLNVLEQTVRNAGGELKKRVSKSAKAEEYSAELDFLLTQVLDFIQEKKKHVGEA